jgi:hypothetical protein
VAMAECYACHKRVRVCGRTWECDGWMALHKDAEGQPCAGSRSPFDSADLVPEAAR